MVYNYTADQVPPPQYDQAALVSILSANQSSGVVAPHAATFARGDESTVAGKLNTNAVRLDVGASGYAPFSLCKGLVPSQGASALLVNVSAGQANIQGIVEPTLIARTGVVVLANSPNWIWLTTDGVFVVEQTLVPPMSGGSVKPAVLIGGAPTDGTHILNFDGSGVVFSRGGSPYRITNDSSIPVDTPPAQWAGYTICNPTQATFYWTGGRYFGVGLGFNFVGDYSGAATYHPNDLVRYGAWLLLCIAATVGHPPVTAAGTVNTTYWELVVDGQLFVGAWAATTAYLPGHLMTYGGGLYLATAPFNSGASFDLTTGGTNALAELAPQTLVRHQVVPTGAIDGANKTFTLPDKALYLDLYWSGPWQLMILGTDYATSVVGGVTQIVTTNAPQTSGAESPQGGDSLYAIYWVAPG